MIVVRVHLHSAITGEVTELARMVISNDGHNPNPRLGDYDAVTLRGRSAEALNQSTTQRSARVHNWPRNALHVWNLVQASLTLMGYGHVKTVDPNREPRAYDGGYE